MADGREIAHRVTELNPYSGDNLGLLGFLLYQCGNDEEAQAMLRKGEFGAGSMGPKIEAAVGFVRGGGELAVIADLEDATDALRGEAGTSIVPTPRG